MKRLKRGVLIAIEGIDGSGKTTLARNLAAAMADCDIPVILTKEPGSTPLGAHIRQILETSTVNPVTETLLFAADRAQHTAEIVKPALESGKLIISDRMADSTRAYQGYGRGIDKQMIEQVTQWALNGIKPDLIFYLAIDVETAHQRIRARNQPLAPFEKQGDDFLERVRSGFEELFKNRKEVLWCDARQPMDVLATYIIEHTKKFIATL